MLNKALAVELQYMPDWWLANAGYKPDEIRGVKCAHRPTPKPPASPAGADMAALVSRLLPTLSTDDQAAFFRELRRLYCFECGRRRRAPMCTCVCKPLVKLPVPT